MTRRGHDGFLLITVLLVITGLATLLTVSLTRSTAELVVAHYAIRTGQAFTLAEAGLDDVLRRFKSFELPVPQGPETEDYGQILWDPADPDAFYHVTLQTLLAFPGVYYVFRSEGTVNGVTRAVSFTVRSKQGPDVPPGVMFVNRNGLDPNDINKGLWFIDGEEFNGAVYNNDARSPDPESHGVHISRDFTSDDPGTDPNGFGPVFNSHFYSASGLDCDRFGCSEGQFPPAIFPPEPEFSQDTVNPWWYELWLRVGGLDPVFVNDGSMDIEFEAPPRPYMPWDLTVIRDDADHILTGDHLLWLAHPLYPDAVIVWELATGTYTIVDDLEETTFFVEGNVYVGGPEGFDGRVTIATTRDANILSSLVYRCDPTDLDDEDCDEPGETDDMLGLFARRDILITPQAQASGSVTLQGMFWAQQGSFEAECWIGTCPGGVGELYLHGAVYQNQAGPMARRDGSSGLRRHMTFDPRFGVLAPPSTPMKYSMNFIQQAWQSAAQ